MRLGTRRQIEGKEVFLVGESGNQNARKLVWFCPVTRKRIRTIGAIPRLRYVDATDEQRRLAKQNGLSVREVVKLTGGVR